MGNHEKMMLDFIDNPTEKGGRWMRFGGLQTLESMKLGGVSERSDDAELLMVSHQLRKYLGDSNIEWLRSLPTHWQSGNIHIVHAAADPDQDMEIQNSRVLLWGHPDFETKDRQDGQWVVYGHTIKEAASANHGRIALDTGAYATGILTAAHITDNNVDFIEAQ
jgi:serine/threonine protein phosphatase 1